ncbi:MAG: hypothetical protein HY958_01885 [Bacteroidia bacterium]|nr:hypothetical protein [Bacteroidia bacterium]
MNFFCTVRYISFFSLGFLLCTSCFLKSKKEIKGNPLAREGEKYLYFDDVKEIIPKDLSKSDSLAFLKNYINKWIKKQVILEKAELSLSEKQKDVSRQLRDYRNVILMHKYEQSIIAQKSDTNISDIEISDYYEKHKNDLKLKESIIVPLFVRIPRNAPNAAHVKIWYKSEKDADLDKLVKYSFKNKGDFFYEEHSWYVFHDFFKKFPIDPGPSEEAYIRFNKFIEFKDSLNYFYVNIKAYKLKNETPPLEYVKAEIKSIILNKRKINLINDIENRLFNDAMSDRHAEIFSIEVKNFSDTVIRRDSLKDKHKKITQ